MSGKSGPNIKRGHLCELAKNKAREKPISLRIDLRRPMPIKPKNELTLCRHGPADALNGSTIDLGCFVAKPLIPMARNAVQWAAQDCAAPEAFLAPMPESPKPDVIHSKLLPKGPGI